MPVIIKLYEQWVEICVKIQGVFFRSTRADKIIQRLGRNITRSKVFLLAKRFYEILIIYG